MLYLQLLTLQNTLATPQAHCHPGSPASQSSDRQAAFCTQQTCEMTYHQSLIRISLHSSNISIHVYSVSVPMVCWLTMSAEVSQLSIHVYSVSVPMACWLTMSAEVSQLSIHVYSVSVPMVCWLTMSAEVSQLSIHVYSVSVPMVCWLTMSAEVSQLTDQQNSSQHQCQLTTFRFLHYKLVSNQSLIRKLKSGFEPMLSEKSSF